MKTIYTAVMARLREKVPALKWIDMEKGQLKKETPDVMYPCAMIGIALGKSEDITDTIQNCRATVSVKLAFDLYTINRTSAQADQNIRDQHLEPYDVIADVYATLQGFGTDNFDPLSRSSQGEESHSKLFVYQIVFSTEFEDYTADQE